MIVHVSVPSRLAKLETLKMELSAALPVAESFHEDVATKAAAVTAAEFAKTDNADPKVVIRAHAAEADASRMAEAVTKSIRRVENTIEGYKLVSGQHAEGFATKLTEEQRREFARFAADLRNARLSENYTAKQRRTEVDNIRLRMMNRAKEIGLPVSEILAGVK